MSSPTGEPGDPRVRRTRQALREALLALIEERGFAAILVQDIADRAAINRVTFYKHYRDKYDLLEQTMQAMLGELTDSLDALLREPSDQAVFDGLVHWLEHVSAHASFYRTMLGKGGNAAFAARLRAHLEAMVSQALADEPDLEPAAMPFAVLLRFSAGGFLSVTEWWLEQRQPVPVREAAHQLHRLLLAVLTLKPPAE
ncbi:MAG TPA: TetR/AcrR family transcriptional regulator C-terminal domain-containing protein [Herpetosiphonaceae bacterium]